MGGWAAVLSLQELSSGGLITDRTLTYPVRLGCSTTLLTPGNDRARARCLQPIRDPAVGSVRLGGKHSPLPD